MQRSYPPLLNHILEGKAFGPILESPDLARHRSDWRKLIKDLSVFPPSDRSTADRFHTQWHVCHHLIRQLVNDDALLTDMLWIWLPRYEGPSLTLYRGENIDRFEAGAIGTAWTDKEDKAKMFASGLNAVKKGGTILKTLAPSEAIIAGPSKHSLYLGESEFTLDIRKIGKISRIQNFGSRGA